MATLTVITPTKAGVLVTPAAAAGGGDKFPNTGREVIDIRNGSGGSITITFAPGGTPGGLGLATYTVVVAAGAEKTVGPFAPELFNDSGGFVNMTYSGVTSLTLVTLQVP